MSYHCPEMRGADYELSAHRSKSSQSVSSGQGMSISGGGQCECAGHTYSALSYCSTTVA